MKRWGWAPVSKTADNISAAQTGGASDPPGQCALRLPIEIVGGFLVRQAEQNLRDKAVDRRGIERIRVQGLLATRTLRHPLMPQAIVSPGAAEGSRGRGAASGARTCMRDGAIKLRRYLKNNLRSTVWGNLSGPPNIPGNAPIIR